MKKIVYIIFIASLFSCSEDDDNGPANASNSNEVKNQPIMGSVKGQQWTAQRAYATFDSSVFTGNLQYTVEIYPGVPDIDYRNPCYDNNRFDTGIWKLIGTVPNTVSDFTLDLGGSSNQYGISFSKSEFNSSESILLLGLVQVQNIDESNNSLTLGLDLDDGVGGDEVNGIINCEICPKEGEYEFQNQNLNASYKGNSLNIQTGYVKNNSPFFSDEFQFFLGTDTVQDVCNNASSFFASSHATFILENLDTEIKFLRSSKTDNSARNIIVSFNDPSNSESWRMEWGAIELVNVDTALNNEIEVKIDFRGEAGLLFNGNYTFNYCN